MVIAVVYTTSPVVEINLNGTRIHTVLMKPTGSWSRCEFVIYP